MNGRFKFSNKKLSVAIAVTVATVLIATVTVMTVALAMHKPSDPMKLPEPPDGDLGESGEQGENGDLGSGDNADKGNGGVDNGTTDTEKPSDDPDDDTSGGDQDKNDQETVVPVPSWTSPVEGYVFKHNSTDELVYSLTLGDYRTHKGIDISASAGSEVRACSGGKIDGVYYDPFMGYCVSISHGDGVVSYYKNLGEDLPEGTVEGREVRGGEVIGYVGESAMIEFSDESHLHFELEVGGNNTDPLEYLEYSDTPSGVENE